MKYLKLLKEGTVEDFINSDKAGFPCVCMMNLILILIMKIML